MSLRVELFRRLRALLHGDQADREHLEETQFHLDMAAAQLEANGVTPDEARRRARLAFGPSVDVREAARDQRVGRRMRWLDDLKTDIPFALRQLRRSPAFAIVSVLTLALGIGATTALFSVIDGVLFRPIPFDEPDRIVVVWETDRRSGTTREPAAWPDYVDFARETRTLERTAAFAASDMSLATSGGDPLRVAAAAITADYFGVLGVAPIIGRTFSGDEDRPSGAKVALLGERLWRTRFNADRSIVGRTVRVDDVDRQVVGIVPIGSDFGIDQVNARAAYHQPYSGVGDVDVWIPLQASESTYPRDTHPFFIVGRIADGSTRAAASQELGAIAVRLEEMHPRSNTARGVWVESLRDVAFAPVRPVLWLLLAAVALVLLVSCVNVANLLLARGAARLREVAVRGALGAGFARLCRQFAAESLILALAGGAAGVVVAHVALRALLSLAPTSIPRVDAISIDPRALAVTLSISIAVGLLFGMMPALQARRVDVTDAFRGEGRGATAGRRRSRLRELLVVGELAMSVTLVLGAGLLVRSVWAATAVDPGFRVGDVLKAEYQLPEQRYPRDFSRFPQWTEIHRFNASVLERVRRIPGVQGAAIAAAHPLDAGFTNSFTVVGREAEARDWPEISLRIVSPGYFETMGVSIRRGRPLAAGDDATAPRVALVNAAAVARFFAGREPLGAEIQFWGMPHRIVGVVDDERFLGVTEAPPPAVYAAIAQAPSNTGVLLVRSPADPSTLASEVRAAIRDADPQLAVYGVEPLAETLRSTLGSRHFVMRILVGFAAVTLVLALIGIHGLLRYATTQRTREIGIRLALGATRGSAAGGIVRSGMRLALVGVALGVIGAAAGSQLLGSFLFGVTRSDPLTYAGVVALVLTAAAFATALPAVSAARVDPVDALRRET